MPMTQLPPFGRELPRGSNLILTLLMKHLARTCQANVARSVDAVPSLLLATNTQ